MMKKFATNSLLLLSLFLSSCKPIYPLDGPEAEKQVLAANDLNKDNSLGDSLRNTLRRINCMDSAFFQKHLRLAQDFHSGDTAEILVIPYSTTQKGFTSEGFSDIQHRVILLNLSAIRNFTALNALSGDKSLLPVIELVALHEIGHFRLGKAGAFDEKPDGQDPTGSGQQYDDTQPEYLTTLKKIELDADSLAIDLVKKGIGNKGNCTDVGFDIELILPGMQFTMFGNGIPQNWFKGASEFLHDPSKDYPNMELRVMFMNYFLYPTPERQQQIEGYLYNRTVAPVHRQESNPRIYQGQEKEIK